MYQRVDTDQPVINGFSYLNKMGVEEHVDIPDRSGIVTVMDSCDGKVEIYKEDIPKLIKALQAAHAHKEQHE